MQVVQHAKKKGCVHNHEFDLQDAIGGVIITSKFVCQSSSSSSSIFHGVGPLVDPFRSHASRSIRGIRGSDA